MDKQGVTSCVPEEDPNAIVDDEYIDFTSGYVQRALDRLPKQVKDSTLKFYNPRTLSKVNFLKRLRLKSQILSLFGYSKYTLDISS